MLNRILFIVLFVNNVLIPSLSINSLCNKIHVSFILGPPLAGKGTQATHLVSEFGCVHLSAGDLLREERASGSELAETIESYITQGSIVPVKITLDLIRKAMLNSGSSRFLIDGFPRNFDNLQGWNENMKDVIVDSCIFLDCPEGELKRRLGIRAKTSGRSDDNIETLEKRLITFRESTLPVVEQFKNNELLDIIAWDGKDIPQVYEHVREKYIPYIKEEVLDITKKLLHASDTNNWDEYQSMSNDDFWICGGSGLEKSRNIDGFINTDFEEKIRTSKVTHLDTEIMGQTACVVIKREILGEGGNVLAAMEETRVWEYGSTGQWKHVCCHRDILS